jgi:DNA-binding PadR family transcriptional regulator
LFFRHFHRHEPGPARRDGFGHGRHGGFDGHHRGRGLRGRDSERVFEHGDLRLVIMALLKEKPRYGYEIIKDLEERVGGGYSPSPGVVYPTLTLLEEVGHASVSDEHSGRRLYTLSAEGLAYLEANRALADSILARVSEASASRRGPSPQVMRAMENLGTALRLRLRGRPASDDQIRVIAAAIDAAAKAIEEA